MRRLCRWLVLIGVLAPVACAPPTELAPVEQGGWQAYFESRIRTPIACGPMPILLAGNRLDTRLTGGCRYVRITGEHNDIRIDAAPGGTIEVSGSHNDIFWLQTQPGPPPKLFDTGVSNSFHQQ